MKGDRFPSELVTEPCPATSLPRLRLTSHPSINHATYFLQSSITPDLNSLIFTSFRSGSAQLYSVDHLPSGEIRQWTDGPAIHPFSAAIHPAGDRVFFVRRGSIWEIGRHTFAERLVIDFGDAQLGEVSLAENGTWLTAAIRKANQPGVVAGRAGGSSWTFIPFPRTVIHPQFHPLDPSWIEFAADPAPRIHRVRRDGSGLECLYHNSNDEFVVHETFLGSSGDLVYTVWPFALWRMNWHSLERRKICDFNAWHITPNRAGTAVLCDTNHPDRGIHLIDVATGTPRLVCLSEASSQGSQWKTSRYAMPEDFAAARSNVAPGAVSWMETATDTIYGPQWTHPHPSFSPDERHVVFTSDRSGHPHVYVAALPAPAHG